MLNNVVLIGRLGKDVEIRYTQGGKAVATLRLAVDRGTTDANGKRETDWIDCITWEKQAESCANHLSKGRMVGVVGRLQIRQWEKDGQRHEKAEVVAREVKFLDRAPQHENPLGDIPARGSGNLGNEPAFADDDDVPF